MLFKPSFESHRIGQYISYAWNLRRYKVRYQTTREAFVNFQTSKLWIEFANPHPFRYFFKLTWNVKVFFYKKWDYVMELDALFRPQLPMSWVSISMNQSVESSIVSTPFTLTAKQKSIYENNES